MNAPAQQLPVLIECEHGYGRLSARACARQHQVAMGKVQVDRSTYLARKNSKCNGCEHGARRVAEGALKQAPALAPAPEYTCEVCQTRFAAPGLRSAGNAPATCSETCRKVRTSRLALERQQGTAPPSTRPRASRALTMPLEEVRARLLGRVKPPTAAKPAEPSPTAAQPGTNGRVCLICSVPLVGRAVRACSLEHSHDYARRYQRAYYYRKQGDDARAEACLRGELTGDQRSTEAKLKRLDEPSPTPEVAKREPIAVDPPRADRFGESDHEVQQQEGETMASEIDRNNMKCEECGARFKAKATGKPSAFCSDVCRKLRLARRVRDRREGAAPAASKPASRATGERARASNASENASRPTPVLAVTEPTPELAAALREPAPSGGPASWPYAVSIGRLAIAVRTIDDLAAIVDRYGGGGVAHAG